MTWVKVCGLSRPEEVEAAVDAGADAVGFVTVPGSPRYLELDRVAGLAEGVPIRRVLLTSDLDPAALLQAVEDCGVDAVQPYGRSAAAAARSAAARGLLVLWPTPVGPGAPEPQAIPGTVPLYDTHRRERPGGTGASFDWSLLADRTGQFVVAGGLGPHNVADLIARIRPWGVDASSGLESAPGVKDLGKVTAFVEEAKSA